MKRFSARTTTALLALALGVGVAVGGFSNWRKARAASCADAGGPACQTCRTSAQAKFCDASYVAPRASGNIKVNGQKGCCGFEDPKLRATCEAILLCLRNTDCAAGNDPSRCLCGDLDPKSCATGGPHTGACVSAYTAGLAGGPPGTVVTLFGSPTSPIGIANNTFTCDVDASCPCGQKK
jgi:hypothetical protein